MTSPKQVKKYSYTKECKKVDRQLCDQVEKSFIKPYCDEQWSSVRRGTRCTVRSRRRWWRWRSVIRSLP